MSSLYLEKLWQFSPIPNIEECNFNKILERFYDMGIVGLTRENIQNSLDGKLALEDKPVVVKIEIGNMKKKEVPGIDEIVERIKCLGGRNTYTKETIEHMLKKIDQENIRYISFEDENTKGLTGAKNGQSNSSKDTWGIYAYNKGFHFEDENKEIETSRGGSHGVGKIASNAASDLYLMFFANHDSLGDKHLGGTIQLIEHIYINQSYRSTGYFSSIEHLDHNKTKFVPFENNFGKVFEKNTRGLKIIIPFLREEFDDEDEIIKCICDNFFVAILENKLEVTVNSKVISSSTISDYVRNSNYYSQDLKEIKKVFTPLYIDTYSNEEPIDIYVSNGDEEYNFKLYFKYKEEIVKGRVAIIRTIGMKIEDFKVDGYANKPYNAVLIGGSKEDLYLKSLENESHTKLSSDHIKDSSIKKKARKFLKNLMNEISSIIEEEMKRNNPTDGNIDTSDIIYIVENQFKRDLEETFEKVKVNSINQIYKAPLGIPKKEKRDKKEINSKNPGDKKNNGPIRTRKALKEQKGKETSDSVEERKLYKAHTDIVQRILIGDSEILQIDLSSSEEIDDTSTKYADISFVLIDGMGEEIKDEFNILNNYTYVKDFKERKDYIVSKNKITNIKIRNKLIRLELGTKETFNKSLKFIYYVEV